MKTLLIILLVALLTASCTTQKVNDYPPLPPGVSTKQVESVLVLTVPAIAPVAASGVVLSVTPATNFTVYATSNILSPRSSWTLIATGFASVVVPPSILNLFTNKPVWRQTLAWNRSYDSIVAGYNIYYGPSNGLYTNFVQVPQSLLKTNKGKISGTNYTFTISGLSQAVYHYAATTYSSNGVESVYSADVSGTPMAVVEPLTVFFCAKANVKTLLKITSQSQPAALAAPPTRHVKPRVVPPRQRARS